MPLRPELTNAPVPLLDEAEALDELGHARHVYIPGGRLLTVHPGKREPIMLMTLGSAPGVLALGYLCNQRLVSSIEDIASIQVDRGTESAAVPMRIGTTDLDEKTTRRTVTTGYGQGTMLGSLVDKIDAIHLPSNARMAQTTLYYVVDAIRLQQSIYRQVGSVHGCALFNAHGQLLHSIEDVGRHNVVDVIAGRMWPEGMGGGDKIFYTTGRLTSEMVTKGMQISIPFLLSHSDVAQMDHQMAQRVNPALFVWCTERHFLLYTGWDRFVAEPGVADMVGPRGELFQTAESGR